VADILLTPVVAQPYDHCIFIRDGENILSYYFPDAVRYRNSIVIIVLLPGLIFPSLDDPVVKYLVIVNGRGPVPDCFFYIIRNRNMKE